MPARATTLAAVALAAAALLAASPASAWRTRGQPSALAPACGAKLDALYAEHYPSAQAAPGGAARPNACKLILDQALAGNLTDRCPDEAGTVDCFNVSQGWRDGGMEGWWGGRAGREGVVARIGLLRRLPTTASFHPPRILQAAPAAWTTFVNECELFAGTPAASATGRRLAAAEGEGEGEGEGAITDAGQGCFPAFKRAADFEAWLKGEFAETKDYGKASPIALVSVAVFTLLLLAMSAA